MRVALLAHLHHPISEPFVGGLEMHTKLVADELVRRGHDVTMFAREHSSTLARLEPILGDDFACGPTLDGEARDRVLDEAVTRALAAVRNGGFDFVFNNSLSPLPYRELDDFPMLTVLHTPPTLVRVNEVIDAPGWRPGDRHAFVAVSQVTAQAWRARLPEVGHVPNGIYLDRWHAQPGRDPDLAVWSARITPEKGLHVAIDAVREAGMRLEFTGAIGDPGYFEDQIVPRMGPDVRYRGHLNHQQLATQLSRAAVFVATPLWAEPFGLAMAEAMACGTPVAALPNGACREVVLPTGGAVADEVGASSLAVAIGQARRMNRRQVRQHARCFDATVMLDRYEALMQDLAQLPGALPESLTA